MTAAERDPDLPLACQMMVATLAPVSSAANAARHMHMVRCIRLLCDAMDGVRGLDASDERELAEPTDDAVCDAVRRIAGTIVHSLRHRTPLPPLERSFHVLQQASYGVIALLLQGMAQRAATASACSLLTRTEDDILRSLGAGETPQTIASKHCCSQHTVRTHIQHIYRKLEVSTRIDAVNRARSIGLLI